MSLTPKNLTPGEEQHEKCRLAGKTRVQYDYRHTDGKLFSCIRPTLEECRAKRDEWLKDKEG